MTSTLDHLDHLGPISLAELDARASLQTRVDRKYVVPADALGPLLRQIHPGARVLQIGADREFAYESVYFDTPELTSYLGAARRRRRRFKVRTRTYVDSRQSWVEVKTRGPRGATVKTRMPHDPDQRGALTPESLLFADSVLELAAIPGMGGAPFLPTLVSRYRRVTLHLPGDSRTTIDTGLVWADPASGADLDLRGVAIIESKTGSTPSSTDRLLWRHGLRPVRISKYGTGMAALHPELPATPWRRVLDRHVQGGHVQGGHVTAITPTA
ncbi:polyphosphate polymerase domain-containing protein [Cellulomonas cellasea]|uniref:polyphosphate polymerase domain-containing protein n=1 Tax=Cellulomonas cellasea TaxID=43670 RepID=UPI0025A4BA02|nr:polyphosphate polymerase domain-containing protein [Cellulomonas cellasea]MDM8084540.1 polyphosphate polymerase domain-containing protein [Cellulomonas cellasea]